MKNSLPKKCTAIGFIVLTLLGNYWLVLVITKQATPMWLLDAFSIAAIFVIGSGLAGLVLSFWQKGSNDSVDP